MKIITLLKNLRIIIFLLTIAVFQMSGVDTRADYKQDEEIRRAAEKLSEMDQAQRRAAKDEYDKEHSGGGGGDLAMDATIIIFLAAGGFYIWLKSMGSSTN